MKFKMLILLTSFFLMGSQVINSQSKMGSLPVLDISKSYPQKEIHLFDIADVQYIALETTDDVLLSGNAILSYVSDKYILVYEPMRGDIFVFDRTGKLYAHFNHKGQSGQEYAWIGSAGPILDEKNEEIFVCNQSIQVYSLNGEYKRTLKINTIPNESKVFNFDDKALLIYDDVIIDRGFENKTKKNPYSLMSKKDGNLISILDIYLPKRYSNRILQIDKNGERSIQIYYSQSIYHGLDFMIADISSDTLYLLTQNKELTPILTRKPSVHASEPRNVWATLLTTDKFMLISMVLLDFNSKFGKNPVFMYEFETGKISKVSVLDPESDRGKWWPNASPRTDQNMTAELIQASSIKNAYNRKKLKVNVDELLKKLSEEDNPVVRIIKFK